MGEGAVFRLVGLAAVYGLAALTQGFVGFGFMLVSLPLAALLLPIPRVVALGLCMSLLSAAQVAWQHRAHVRWRWLLRVLAPGMTIGVCLGFVLSDLLPPAWLKRALGAVVLLSVVLSQLSGSYDKPFGPLGRNIVAASAGVTQGLFGVAGPLVVLLMSRERFTSAVFRGTLTALWSVVNLCLVTVMAIKGRYGEGLWWTALCMLPALWCGNLLARQFAGRVSERTFSRVVWVGLCVMGLSLLVR